VARIRSRIETPRAVAIMVAVLVGGSVLGLRALGWLERLELVAYDHQARLAALGPEQDPRVALVEVGEADIRALGTWPIPDGKLAQVIDQVMGRYRARAFGVDIYRDIPVSPGSEELDAVLDRTPRVVFPLKYGDKTTKGVAPPPRLAGTQQVGFNNMVMDRDGMVRRGLLYMDDDAGGVGVAFAFTLAVFYLGDQGIVPGPDPEAEGQVRVGHASFPRVEPQTGSYVDVDAEGYQYLLDCRGQARGFPSASLRDVLEGRAEPSLFRDRIVILGITADSVPDLLHSACSAGATSGVVPGAVLHAHMASQVLRYALGEGSPLRVLGEWPEGALIAAFALFGAMAGLWTRSTWRFVLFCGGVLLALWLGAFAAIAADWWLPAVPAAAGCLVSVTAMTAYLSSRDQAERAELMQLFSSHVTKQVAEEIWRQRVEYLEGGRPRPQRVTATILFVDMKNYTSRAEKMDPGELMQFLDAYLQALSKNVLDAGGMVEDYFGDGVMACFGVPMRSLDEEGVRKDAQSAVHCALEMERSVQRLNVQWAAHGLSTIGIRVGICTGPVVVGSMGSRERLKYSVVGDAVVTAQRLESLDDSGAHDFETRPCRILISPQTREYLGESAVTHVLGEFRLKGKSEPMLVHEVLGRAVV